jgi:hypothetical protein
MAVVSTSIQIEGAINAVFDLMTTARFWSQWHPATTGVGGVTERPFQLGDVIREQARIGQRTHEGNWTVAEHERPRHVLLRMAGDRLRIQYDFVAEGGIVTLTRRLEYPPEDFAASVADPAVLERLMENQSQQALTKLKALIEAILRKESDL